MPPLFRPRAWRRYALSAAVLAALPVAHSGSPPSVAAATPQGAAQERRIVAIGDIHGAFDAFAGVLRAAGLVDAGGKWTGGRTILVQTGDVFDRGPGVRPALDLLMRLEGEARKDGGRVDALLGNHEVMNLLFEFRDVSAEAMAAFADNRSEDRRRRAFDEASAVMKRRTPAAPPLDREAWMRQHPPGFIEYAEALSSRGRYGRWLRGRKVVLKEGDTIFNHAGIGPETPGSADDVNRLVARELAAWDTARELMLQAGIIRPFFTYQETVESAVAELQRIAAAIEAKSAVDEHVTREYVEALQRVVQSGKSALLAGEGPLWFRGYARWPDSEAPQVDALLSRLGVARVVCGHTPIVPGAIGARFGGKVILIDTGMLTSFFKGGRPSALEIQGSRTMAIYQDGREPVGQAVAR